MAAPDGTGADSRALHREIDALRQALWTLADEHDIDSEEVDRVVREAREERGTAS